MDNNKRRFGQPADIARLDFHDWGGRIIDRTKAKTGEKVKGVLMIEKIKDRFGLDDEYIRNVNLDEIQEEKRLLFEHEPIKWKRDAKGNVI
jgi:hypothetical protein